MFLGMGAWTDTCMQEHSFNVVLEHVCSTAEIQFVISTIFYIHMLRGGRNAFCINFSLLTVLDEAVSERMK